MYKFILKEDINRETINEAIRDGIINSFFNLQFYPFKF